jgi:hypothetical protein
MRVFKADIPDIERGLVRVPPESFGPLAISGMGRIVVESVKQNKSSDSWELARRSLAAYELTEDFIHRRAQQALEDRERYPERTDLNVGDNDIWGIYMDQYARDQLGVSSRAPVKVRHSSRNLFAREAQDAGLVFVATMLIAAGAVIAVSPLHHLGWLELGIAVFVASVATAFLTIVSIRGRAGR